MNKDEIFDKLIKLLEKIGYFEIVKDDEKYEEFIQNLSLEQFKRILNKFNQFLIAGSIKDKGEYENPSIIANNFGIRQDLRDELLEEILNNIKEIKDDKIRGAYAYYSLLRMHMFKDGNGRTSRMVNLLLNKTTDFDEFKEFFEFHESDETNGVHEKFENKIGIPDIRIIANMVKKSYDHIFRLFKIKLPELDGKKIIAYTSGYRSKLDYLFLAIQNGKDYTMAPHKIKQIFEDTKYEDKLDPKTKIDFACYLCDGISSKDNSYNYGGIISTILFYKKGILDKFINYNKDYNNRNKIKFEFLINKVISRYENDKTYEKYGITKEELNKYMNEDVEQTKKRNGYLLDTSEFRYNYNMTNVNRFDDFSLEDFNDFVKIGDEIKRLEFSLIGETFKKITDINDIDRVYEEKVKNSEVKSL